MPKSFFIPPSTLTMPDQLNPMAPFVEAIQERWWQGPSPPIANHTMAKDLSIVKAWLRQRYDREELIGALNLYDGPPATLRLTYAAGQRHLLTRLIGQFRIKREISENRVCSVLADMASRG